MLIFITLGFQNTKRVWKYDGGPVKNDTIQTTEAQEDMTGRLLRLRDSFFAFWGKFPSQKNAIIAVRINILLLRSERDLNMATLRSETKAVKNF